MQTIASVFSCKYEIKKSLFIAYILPMNEFETFRSTLKAEHPKAAHIVWSYRFLNEFDQIVESANDDGEPKGTSAQPILNVLRGAEIINAAVIVVRYFGGVKLGTGGLVRAYGTSAKMVLEQAEFFLYIKKEMFEFVCKYTFLQRTEYFLKKLGISCESKKFESENVKWTAEVTREQKEEIKRFLADLSF